jgi:hypothetical protein
MVCLSSQPLRLESRSFFSPQVNHGVRSETAAPASHLVKMKFEQVALAGKDSTRE